MVRDYYKGIPRTKNVILDRNNNLVISRPHIGDLPLQVSSVNVYDALNFGAVGDGVVNDTSAIQAAIDAACSASTSGLGGIVFLPARLYKVTSTLTISQDNVWIIGSSRRATRIQYYPPTHSSLFLYEKLDDAILNCGIAHIELRAANDTTYVKRAIDVHGARKFHLHHVTVQGWSDTSKNSCSLYLCGWDNLRFDNFSFTSDIPIIIGQNEDDEGDDHLDTAKDLDHCVFSDFEVVANNEDKISIKILGGAVFRNLTFQNFAGVQGGISCIDTEAPRRRSTNLRVANARFEGFAETDGDVDGTYAIDIQRHINGQLRNLTVDNVLLAEGADARYGTTTGANWNGIRTFGVWRTSLVESTYSGWKVPITVASGKVNIFGGQWTEQDFGRATPECEAQWDQLDIARPRSWWKFSSASGNPTDQQDAAVSGKTDRTLTAAGSPGYQQFSDGWHGYQGGFTEASGQRFGLPSASTEFSPQDRSAAWLAYWNFPTGWTPGGDRILITLGSPTQSGANGPNVYINSQGRIEAYAGSTVVTGTVNYLGHDCAFLPVYNRTGSTWEVHTATVASGIMETITGTYSASVGNTNPKGFGAPDTFTSCSGTIRFGAMWFDEDAESLDETTLEKLGW